MNRLAVQTPLSDAGSVVKRRLLNIQEVAEYIGLSTHTVYTMVSQRRIPFVKVGRLTKFDLRGIDDWIAKNTVPPVKRKGVSLVSSPLDTVSL